MPDTHQFFISEGQLMRWAQGKSDFVDVALLTDKTVLETLYGTVFPHVDDFMVSYSDDENTLYCDDLDLMDGERSIEIVRTEPDPDHEPENATDSIFQVTITDTVGDIANVEAILRLESLLDESEELEHAFVFRMRHKSVSTRTASSQLLVFLTVTFFVAIIAMAMSGS